MSRESGDRTADAQTVGLMSSADASLNDGCHRKLLQLNEIAGRRIAPAG